MNILAFDTAMGGGSVAVVADGALVASRREDNARALAEQLVPMIDAVLADAAITYAGLDRLGVTIGPGTFTGMRIGVATARAIALSAQLPLVGLSTFEVMAQQYLNKYLKIETISICFDARRNEIYHQSFRRSGTRYEATTPPVVCPVDQIGDHIPTGIEVIAGSGASLVAGLAQADRLHDIAALDARVIAQIAAEKPAPDMLPEPLYLRRPDAKLPGGREPETA